ncbi:MAG: hypothetical protein ACRC2H_10210 [Silanimonas sp.]
MGRKRRFDGRRVAAAVFAIVVAGAASGASTKTEVLSEPDALRIEGNSGLTLQWLESYGAPPRGEVTASWINGVLQLRGEQQGSDGAYVRIDGVVTRIEARRFQFRGRLSYNLPPVAYEYLGPQVTEHRRCDVEGDFEFFASGQRRYWRWQQMEACGNGTTDYIDLYF